MSRCKTCESCIAATSFRKNNAGQKQVKTVTSFENRNMCKHPIAPNKKRRVTEMDVLSSGGSGSRMRTDSSHDQPTPYIERTLKARTACPDGSYNEAIHFNQVAFDKYAKLVLQCADITMTPLSSDVRLEELSMISKMRGLLDPDVKDKVDYEEVVKEVSNIWLQWLQGEAAGN